MPESPFPGVPHFQGRLAVSFWDGNFYGDSNGSQRGLQIQLQDSKTWIFVPKFTSKPNLLNSGSHFSNFFVDRESLLNMKRH